MSRRQRKDKKRKQKRLERVPEKLQRKRDRQERQRSRRMPGWIRTSLVVVLIAIIIGGAFWVWWINLPDPIPSLPVEGEVYVLQQDSFFVFINDTGHVQIDFMLGRFAGGTWSGDQWLNVSIARSFDENQVNFTLIDPYVFYDYYGNAYHIPLEVEADSLEFNVDLIQPNMFEAFEEHKLRGGATMRGFWSLFWHYIINSSDNLWLQTDTMEDMFTFTFDIHPENDTLPYNIPTIVQFNITFNTLSASETNVFNYGESMILFPKQVYNDTTLLANMTVHDVYRIGSRITDDLIPTIDNETHIGFQANPITASMSQNQSWGYAFDLNVTTFTNETFSLIDLTTPENVFFLQSGFTGVVLDQPMHFPKAQINILTPRVDHLTQNVTDIEFRFPEIRVDNGTIHYHVPSDSFGPRIYSISPPSNPEPRTSTINVLEGIKNDSSNLDLQTIFWFAELRRFFLLN